MRLHKTGHHIADTISDLIGELPDGDYTAAYGILRHNLFRERTDWFEIDRGFWDASHYGGMYRLSYQGTQPCYAHTAPHKEHGLTLEPWRTDGHWTMICPPTQHVCEFFGIDATAWIFDAIQQAKMFNEPYMIRDKSMVTPINWDAVRRIITFNSTVGVEALRRGIPVISDPVHSSIGSYITNKTMEIDGYDREPLFSFLASHQFKLSEKDAICSLIKYYLNIESS